MVVCMGGLGATSRPEPEVIVFLLFSERPNAVGIYVYTCISFLPRPVWNRIHRRISSSSSIFWTCFYISANACWISIHIFCNCFINNAELNLQSLLSVSPAICNDATCDWSKGVLSGYSASWDVFRSHQSYESLNHGFHMIAQNSYEEHRQGSTTFSFLRKLCFLVQYIKITSWKGFTSQHSTIFIFSA